MTDQPWQLVQFTRGYIAALIWSSGEELDGAELSPQAELECMQECGAFFEQNFDQLHQAADSTGYDWTNAGHDFALTRNHHGGGFWDGDLPDELGQVLTDKANAAGERSPYIGDDGLIYLMK